MKTIKVQYMSDIPESFTGIVEYRNRDREWYKNGGLHREDGPAVEHLNGHKEWWVDDIQYAEPDLEYFCKNCIFLGKEKGKHGLVWLKFLDEDEIEEFPIIPGMDISELQRIENKNGI